MRVLLALAPLLLLAACVPEGQPRLHEIVLYGSENVRLSYLYGSPTTLMLGDDEVTLVRGRTVEGDPLALAEALSVEDRPYLRERVRPLSEPPNEVRTISRSSDLRVAVREDSGPILYFDGRRWFTLLGDARSGMDTSVVPRPRIGDLRGIGSLTGAEADALARYLEAEGPVVVTVLDEVPATARVADGVSEYLRTGLHLQRKFSSSAAATQPSGEELVWEVMARGAQATGFEEQAFQLVNDPDSLRNLWNRAHGSQLQVPPVPEVEFGRETIVALFMGRKPTGGYAIEVEGVNLRQGELFVDVRLVEPGEGAITTQAITSPWTMIRILRGGIDAAWVRQAGSDRLLGAATPASR
ncbi:MAG: protease complex subunit PrcB family protein [Trueperaceae bacterium]